MWRTKECDVEAEPQDGVWWTSSEDGRSDWVSGVEVLVESEKLAELTLCGTPTCKPRSITH